MASARAPGGGSSPSARLSLDLSSFQSAPAIAREAGRATAREISNAFKSLQSEQRLAQTQAQQTLAVLRGQQAQISAVTRAESSVRISAARAEGIAQQQAARAAATTTIEEQKRLTAQFKTELRERERANRQSQVSAGAFGRGAATFAGAALGGPIGGLAGALAGGSLPLAAGLAVGQGARFALEASQTAIAYNRQELAAVSLAGSQGKLNTLMSAYDRATGGAIDKASALSNVTRLMAVGFADNAAELTRFTTGVRGAAIAMGKTQDEIGQEVQLAISNQSFKRLDQIGLGIGEVNGRIAELRASNQGMTREAAFQEAVLGLLNDKYGALAKSAEGQATGTERLTKSWADMRLELGQEIQVNTNQATGALADLLDWISKVRAENKQLMDEIQQSGEAEARRILAERGQFAGPRFTDPVQRWMTSATGNANPSRAMDTDPEGARQVRLDWAAGITDLNAQTHASIIAEETSFGTNRANTVSNYNRSVAREEADFARQRLYAERKFALSLLDIAQDSARQRVKWEEELARNIAQAQADSAERVSELREDSGKRLVESEEKYAEDREKRLRASQKTLREAAANLDAVAVREEQIRFRDEAKEAKDAHEEQKNDIQAQLNERLDDEAKSLAKSEKQARETNARRVEEQAANDALRIEEMKVAFEAQKIQEDEERGIRLGRQAEDHAAQLAEMDTQHGLRLNQIRTHAIREREALQLAADEALIALGAADAATQKRHEEREKAEEKLWDDFHKHVIDSMTIPRTQAGGPVKAYASGGYVPETGMAMLHAGEYVMPAQAVAAGGGGANNSRSVTIGDISVTIQAPASFAPNEESKNWLYGAMADFMEDFAA